MVAQGYEVQLRGRCHHGGGPARIARAEVLALLPATTRAMAGLFSDPQFVLLRQVEPAA
jgi:hypothetical protein